MATIAPALLALRAEVNAAAPHRDKRSDGIVGDKAHEARGSASDHNAWLGGLYRAIDVDKDLQARPGGLTAGAYAETIRQLGARGDKRLRGGGYVIWNGKIASDATGWAWAKHTGANPHTEHVHMSLSRDLVACSSTAGWGIAPSPTVASRPPAVGGGAGLLVDGRLGLATVRALQADLGVFVDGDLGPKTIRALQARLGITVDGLWRDQTTRALQERVGAKVDGDWGPESVKALQRRLNAGSL